MTTITALATPPGVSGIAVVRLSGDNAIEIADNCFKSKSKLSELPSHSVAYGKFYDTQQLIDNVLITIFRKPNSYTGEDVIEISCHGGYLVAGEIISTLLKHGARPAEPGEFTKRAFLNGKIDLTQVEAVADIIHSSSVKGVHTSARQLAGEFTTRLKELRNRLVEIAGLLELELDFADEDIELLDRNLIKTRIENTQKYCKELAESYKSAEILRSGFFVGIAGYPNAGKSKLFNTLLQRNRAIVSEIPGTTRDYLEENIMLGGIIIRLIDTAGIRDSKDVIEIEGIKMVESILKQSNMILVLNDISISENHSDKLYHEIKEKYPHSNIQLIQNKIDLIEIQERKPTSIYISAKMGDGIEELKSVIEQTAKLNTERLQDVLVNQRQANLLTQASIDLENAINSLQSGLSNEVIAIDIRNSAQKLGEITGESWSEEVLNTVFGKFCIGK
ncbi:tRNA uridine-5-carboxymethylaminomethyl(34) synthesis GTPase MnmE [Bacteroidetes/Chlorobi group bacterium ChocPot_Mid]|nr:MAG: tRNA uridine-5-carboxymethylaminomethyl(34) synthesis GTPase MnmE [Bacteroidetes/Chlorobi group bacterium ChocPot_Mid]